MTEPIEPTAEQSPPVGEDNDDLDPKASLEALRKARREAAGLRARLREAEETIGAQAARESARDKAEVERIAAEHLIDATDIWRAEPNLQAFYDGEFHEITKDRVVETAKELIARSPHLAKPPETPPRPPTDRPVEGLRSGATPERKPAPATWSQLIHGA